MLSVPYFNGGKEWNKMGREIKRVPLDFAWPLNKVWKGFLNPHYEGHCSDCASCRGSGHSPQYQALHDKWYGNSTFTPEENGSIPFNWWDHVILAKAQNAVARSPEYFGGDTIAVAREAIRLAENFNSHWCYHLNSDDVAALLAADRLWDFTRNPRTPEEAEVVKAKVSGGGNSWLPASNGYVPTPREVNVWAITGFGHDAINCWTVVKAKCRRLKLPQSCRKCKGQGLLWDAQKNKRIAEAWKPEEPPAGDGWQVWETVSEGSPITLVFETSELCADWLVSQGYSREGADAFVISGWVPSMISVGGTLYRDVDSAAVQSH